jgi:thiol-disulfide isomerase/thioredoxin
MPAMRAKLPVLLVLAVCAGAVSAQERPQFPDLELLDGGGRPLALSAVIGKATVVNFWATWCGPCRVELPELQKLYNELGGKGLVVLPVNVDHPALRKDMFGQDTARVRPRVESFAASSGLTLPMYYVDGPTQAQLGLGTIPLTVLLDRKGGVVRMYEGYSEEGMRDMRELVAQLVAESSGKKGSAK